MKHLRLSVIITITSLMTSCGTHNIKGVFVNLDNTQSYKEYQAFVTGDTKRIRINEKGEFTFKAPKKGTPLYIINENGEVFKEYGKEKTIYLGIENSEKESIVVKDISITNETQNVIVLNNGIAFLQKAIVVEKGEDFKSIYEKAVKDFEQLDKEQTKEIKGVFIDLRDKKEGFYFNVHNITTQIRNQINDKGQFKFKYPKNTEQWYNITIAYYNPPAHQSVGTLMKNRIPSDTEGIIALFDGVRKKMIFVKEGEDFGAKYKLALEEFKEEKTPKGNHPAIYPGCEKYDVADYEKCFTEKINEHIAYNFDAGFANSLGLSEGRYRIMIEFEVDETGRVNILSIQAPHEDLKKEVGRVFKKLPKIEPAMQNGEYIKSMYNLPIYFNVE